jgi:nitrite reductase/ring-hydroxylating ferredoxin subunit
MSSTALTFYPVANVSDFGPGELKYVEVGPDYEPVCLINYEGEFYALGDCCTHQDASLSDGEIVGDELECPLHGGSFKIKTGAPASFPVVTPTPKYEIKVEDDKILIGI